jgi:hypothetical protein
MIKGCPGRYIIKHKRTNQVLVHGTPVTALDTATFLTEALGRDLGSDGMVVHDLQSEKCVDRVQVVVFPDSGGVITYCKRDEDAPPTSTDAATPRSSMLYVHTLNTASGLKRKLQGLGLDHVLR